VASATHFIFNFFDELRHKLLASNAESLSCSLDEVMRNSEERSRTAVGRLYRLQPTPGPLSGQLLKPWCCTKSFDSLSL
jgi:hypothetical protein